jgi:hypothetical protein
MNGAMNIEIQLNAADCRNKKHGITKRTIIVAGELFVPVEKNKLSLSSCIEGAT